MNNKAGGKIARLSGKRRFPETCLKWMCMHAQSHNSGKKLLFTLINFIASCALSRIRQASVWDEKIKARVLHALLYNPYDPCSGTVNSLFSAEPHLCLPLSQLIHYARSILCRISQDKRKESCSCKQPMQLILNMYNKNSVLFFTYTKRMKI